VLPKSSGVFPADRYSLVQTTDPNVLLWAVKPADDGMAKGLVLRLWNLSDAPASTQVTLHGGIASAWRSTHVETDLEALQSAAVGLPLAFARQQVQTVRLLPLQTNTSPQTATARPANAATP